MQGERSVKRRVVIEKTNTSGKVARSNALCYFDTLSQEVVSTIVTYLSTIPLSKWSKYELFECIGIFGDVVRCSFTVASMSVWKKSVDMLVRDGQLLEKEKDYMHVWGQYFILTNPKLSDSFRYLRSVRLDLKIEKDIPSLDVLFASCGGVLQELELRFHWSMSWTWDPILNSIANHCLSLQTFSLVRVNYNFACVPLFRSIGGGLRCLRLIIGSKPPRSMWQHCTQLEELELSSAEDLSFVADIQSLRVITFCECPTADELRTLIGLVPDVGIRITKFIDTVEFGQVIHVCGKQLRALRLCVWRELPPNLVETCSSLVNIETLSLSRVIDHSTFLDSFFIAPKPNLRKLVISRDVTCSVFDFLATKLSALECLMCGIKVPDTPMDDTHMSKFLHTNQRLQYLKICYRTEPWGVRPGKKWYATFVRNTALLIRSLKRHSMLREFIIDTPSNCRTSENLLKMIADACVGFRGRALGIDVDGIPYLKNGMPSELVPRTGLNMRL